MKIELLKGTATDVEADAVVVGVAQSAPLVGSAKALDDAAGGLVGRLVSSGEFTAKLGETLALYAPPGVRSPLVLLVGLGPADGWSQGTSFRAAAAAARSLAAKKRKRVACFFGALEVAESHASAAIAGLLVGSVGQDLYRAEKKLFPFETCLVSGGDAMSLDRGRVLGEAVNLTRRLVNEPPQTIYPASFAERVAELAAEAGMEAEIWDEKRLAKERMNAMLGVAQGSTQPPRLAMLHYRGAAAGAPTLALVGKGVTFDSGGLSLKTPESMKTMKCDMAGAATVLAAMSAIARLKIKANVLGMMGLVENMPGPAAYKLGDVLTARNGRTIEILNTDAEGRLVLADVLSLAVERGAARIVDLATLTGSCVVALGTQVAGVMTNDQAWCDELLAAAREAGEPCWQMPMFAEYGDLVKSDVADLRNTGEGRWAGSIAAAKFLEAFVGTTPWTHVDIAGPAFAEKPTAWSDAGATGYFVRTLVELVRRVAGAK